jgi:hypothetical protein
MEKDILINTAFENCTVLDFKWTIDCKPRKTKLWWHLSNQHVPILSNTKK